MKQLFELALQLEPPWRVVSSDFDFERRRVDLHLGFRPGSQFPCPKCGRACQAVEFTDGTWRQPDVMAFEAFVTARLPSIRCPEHGDLALTPSWASEHVSLRAPIRDGNSDQLGDTSAHPSSGDAPSTRELRTSPPASSSLTGWISLVPRCASPGLYSRKALSAVERAQLHYCEQSGLVPRPPDQAPAAGPVLRRRPDRQDRREQPR